MTKCCRVSDATSEIVEGITFIIIMGVGSISTITLNIKSYGFFKGLWLTLFGVIYIVSAMISVLGFAIALWNLFVQMLVALLPWVIGAFVLYALAHAGGKSEDEFSSAGHNATNERDARKQRETDESRARQREEDEYRRWRWEKRQREEKRGY